MEAAWKVRAGLEDGVLRRDKKKDEGNFLDKADWDKKTSNDFQQRNWGWG